MPDDARTSIPITCPECGARFRVAAQYAGRRGKCPKPECGTTIQIPVPDEALADPLPLDQLLDSEGTDSAPTPVARGQSRRDRQPRAARAETQVSQRMARPGATKSSGSIVKLAIAGGVGLAVLAAVFVAGGFGGAASRAGSVASDKSSPAVVAGSAQVAAASVPTPAETSTQNAGEPTADALAPESFQTHAAPFLKQYCLDCHTGADAAAGIAFEKYSTEAEMLASRRTWERSLEMIRSGIMPPADSAQPSATERDKLLAYLDPALNTINCQVVRDPGRVTLRRLNRNEYNNTVRDLLGVSLRPADKFPSDDVGYGFDNIGDVLSISPLLLEKYFDAAETLAAAAILDLAELRERRQMVTGEQLIRSNVAHPHGRGVVLVSVGDVAAEFELTLAGKYRVEAIACGQPAGADYPLMELLVDEKSVGKFEVPVKDENFQPYGAEFDFTPGRHKLSARFLNDFYNEKARNPKLRDRNLLVAELALIGPLSVPDEALPASHRRLMANLPDASRSPLEAARLNLAGVVRRAFRRPVTKDEVERFAKIAQFAVDQGETFARGMRAALTGLLVSPDFLFRRESGSTTREGDLVKLSDHEIATRLSYFLWNTLPDDELMKLAELGTLSQPATLDRQVTRMLSDERSQTLAYTFGEQWLQLRVLDDVTPDPAKFPEFSPELRRDMKQETLRCVARVFREDRSVLDLLESNETFLNERLAHYYGVTEPAVTGDDFRLIKLDNSRRSGVMTQASILTLTSNPDRTSPVKRGKWIMEVILDSPVPPAPANVPEFAASMRAAPDATLREQLELHRKNPACASCHRTMDALGFGLENFDAIGRWRDRDGANFVDATGELPDGSRFAGPRELSTTLLLQRRRFIETLTEKLLTYALGRGLEFPDRCTVLKTVEAVEKNGYRSSVLVREIVTSDPFLYRRAE